MLELDPHRFRPVERLIDAGRNGKRVVAVTCNDARGVASLRNYFDISDGVRRPAGPPNPVGMTAVELDPADVGVRIR